MYYFFICGNPGFGWYYEPFMDAIVSTTEDQYTILEHRGHLDGSEVVKSATYLTHIINTHTRTICHKIKQLNPSSDKTVDITIIGHSIGAFMALKINEKLNDTSIQYIALFPTICDMHVRKDVRVMLDFIYKPAVMLMCRLPKLIRYLILRQIEGHRTDKL